MIAPECIFHRSSSVRNSSRLLLGFLICLKFGLHLAQAQINNLPVNAHQPDTAYIQWVGQWPSAGNNPKSHSTGTLIKDFFLGKKTLKLSKPVSVLAGKEQVQWILDQGNNALFHVIKESVETPPFIEKSNSSFPSLVGLSYFHRNRNDILFTDSYINKILLVDPDNEKCVVLNDSLMLEQPTGIAYSEISHEIWVVETGAHRISVLNEKGERIKTIGSRGSGMGAFNFPTHIWIDKGGSAYVVDAMNFRVQIFNTDGKVLSVFGKNGDATGYFASPKGIATDSYGNVYITDALFHAVQIFDTRGIFLYNFGGQGHGPGEFWMPAGIFIDDDDRIYVADSYNSRIQIFQLVTGSKK